MRRAARTAAFLLVAVVTLATCGNKASVGSSAGTGDNPAALNGVSAKQVVGDTVSVYKFSTTGQAQKYAGSISHVYLVEDIAVVFAPSVTADMKQEYEAVAARAAA